MAIDRRDYGEYVRLLIEHERELREQYQIMFAEALKAAKEEDERRRRLLADDYARRLEHLNNAYAKADEVKNTFLPREKFDDWRREDMKWKEEIARQTSEQRGAQTRTTAMIGGGLTILTILLNILAYFVNR